MKSSMFWRRSESFVGAQDSLGVWPHLWPLHFDPPCNWRSSGLVLTCVRPLYAEHGPQLILLCGFLEKWNKTKSHHDPHHSHFVFKTSFTQGLNATTRPSRSSLLGRRETAAGLFIFMATNGKPNSKNEIYMHIYIYVHLFIHVLRMYIYICKYIYMCVCVFMCDYCS